MPETENNSICKGENIKEMKPRKNFPLKTWQTVVLILAVFLAGSFKVNPAQAAEKNMEVAGKIYEFEEKSEYEVSSSEAAGSTDDYNPLGQLTVSGEIIKTWEKEGITAYEAAEDKVITLSYTYDNSLLNAGEEEWHLADENKKTADGIPLDKKIGRGAIILQTSLDGEKWAVDEIDTDLVQSGDSAESSKIFQTNEIQLTNGCYYRVMVVYKTEIKTDPKKVLFMDVPKHDCKKYAEVYEFYAGYKGAGTAPVSGDEKRYSLGTLVNAGKDKGYSGSDQIEGDDLHYGWELGNFFVSGYTEKTDDQIFLKNVGDKITLWFNLKQDIDQLNGNQDLKVVGDKDGYDQYFQTSKMNFGRGALIIRYTNHEGVKGEPVIYENYLEALTCAGADVKVRLFEEGDYEVALDYEIKDSKILGKTSDYRISFEFKVRNGNCMVYPFDVITNSELTDSSVTENGFYLDLARSRYLKINVTMARWTKGASGYTEDVRYNRPAKNGEQYTDEGIYTIEVSNPSTGKSTEKKIYVGKDNILMASMNRANAGYTINEIWNLVEQGAKIQEDGSIILPATEAVTEEETEEEVTEEEVTEENTEGTTETENEQNGGDDESTEADNIESSVEADEKRNSGLPFIILGLTGALGIGVFIFRNSRKKTIKE